VDCGQPVLRRQLKNRSGVDSGSCRPHDQATAWLRAKCINRADELNGAAILNVDHLHGQCMRRIFDRWTIRGDSAFDRELRFDKRDSVQGGDRLLRGYNCRRRITTRGGHPNSGID
jgi:hypothetical protein